MEFSPSELILNPDGSIYHLHLKAKHIGNKIIVCGDPQRVQDISDHFDSVEYKISNREFVTHSGSYNGEKICVIATGIGTDNIDIVVNELDALANIDLEKRIPKAEHTTLDIVRIGTCGSLQKNLDVDTAIFSSYAIGLDGLLHFYKSECKGEEKEILNAFLEQTNWRADLNQPYVVAASPKLVNKISSYFTQGITVTANGFYGPQGRILRIPLKHNDLNKSLSAFKYNKLKILNLEMECSGLYGLSHLLGHHAATVCAVVANREAKKFSKNPQPTIQYIIEKVLKGLTNKGE